MTDSFLLNRRQLLGLGVTGLLAGRIGVSEAEASAELLAGKLFASRTDNQVRLLETADGSLAATFRDQFGGKFKPSHVGWISNGFKLLSRRALPHSVGRASLVPLSGGEFMAIYDARIDSDFPILGQRIDASGEFVGDPEVLAKTIAGVYDISAVRLSGGSIIVAFIDRTSTLRVFRLNKAGRLPTRPAVVSYGVRYGFSGEFPLVALSNNRAVVVFQPPVVDPVTKWGGRLIGSDGKPVGRRFSIGKTGIRGSLFYSTLSLAAIPGGNFAIAWSEKDFLSNDDAMVELHSGISGKRIRAFKLGLAEMSKAPAVCALSKTRLFVVAGSNKKSVRSLYGWTLNISNGKFRRQTIASMSHAVSENSSALYPVSLITRANKRPLLAFHHRFDGKVDIRTYLQALNPA